MSTATPTLSDRCHRCHGPQDREHGTLCRRCFLEAYQTTAAREAPPRHRCPFCGSRRPARAPHCGSPDCSTAMAAEEVPRYPDASPKARPCAACGVVLVMADARATPLHGRCAPVYRLRRDEERRALTRARVRAYRSRCRSHKRAALSRERLTCEWCSTPFTLDLRPGPRPRHCPRCRTSAARWRRYHARPRRPRELHGVVITGARFARGPVLYEFIGPGSRLLYVGKTVDIAARTAAHLRDEPWLFDLSTTLHLIRFRDSTTLDRAESHAIRTRSPIYNINRPRACRCDTCRSAHRRAAR